MGKIHDRYIAKYNREIAKNPEDTHQIYRDVWILFEWEEKHEISPWDTARYEKALRELAAAGEAEMVAELNSGMKRAMEAMGKENPQGILYFERSASNG